MSILSHTSAESLHPNTGKNTVEISDAEVKEREEKNTIVQSQLAEENAIQKSKQEDEAQALKKILLDSNESSMLPEDTLKILLDIYTEDQQTRLSGDGTKATIADLKNQKIIERLLPTLEKYNWDKEYSLGKNRGRLEMVIRLVIQHADNNPLLQKEFFQKYEDRLSPSHKAYLQDRIGVNTKSGQVHATQGYNEGKAWYFKPISGIDISKKDIHKTEKGLSYIELNNEDIKRIDILRDAAQIGWSTTEYYNSMSSKVSSQNDGKIKMLVDYYGDTMKLDPTTFDQNKQVGWRKYSEGNMKRFLISNGKDISGFNDAIQVMKDYLENYSFEEGFNGQMDRRGIEFHLGQQYAMIGDYTEALKWFTKLQSEGNKRHGKEYLDATIAFLKRDKGKLDKIYSTSHSLKSEGDKEFIARLHTYFNKSYIEAYNGGMSLSEQIKFLENQG